MDVGTLQIVSGVSLATLCKNRRIGIRILQLGVRCLSIYELNVAHRS